MELVQGGAEMCSKVKASPYTGKGAPAWEEEGTSGNKVARRSGEEHVN